jgi:hypothetical protein
MLLTLTACGTLDGKLDNRLAVTLACDKTVVVSEYGPIGISNNISAKDHEAIAKAFCGK